jgi:polyribonucleotide 5'-hydroxyl-kinase
MTVELEGSSELRIEVPSGARAKFVLAEGTAEINGEELLVGKWYTVKDGIFSIFSYSGCELKVSARESFYYKSRETNMPHIFNLFYALHQTQKKRILVVGEGRTTLANILANYFIRKQKKVLGIDLDVHSGSLLFPGCISAGVIDELFGPVDPFSLQEEVAYFYGSYRVAENTDLYSALVSELMGDVEKKAFPGPHIIVGHKEITKDEIEGFVKAHKIEQVVIIGDEKLFHLLSLEDERVYIPRFGGAISRTMEQRRACIAERIRRFFYGGREEYTPCTITIRVDGDEQDGAYRVVQVGEEHMAPMSALPLGAPRRMSSMVVRPAQPAEGFILAVSTASRMEDVKNTPVLGFLVVVQVISDKEIKVLCPQPRCLKNRFLVQGKVRLVE